MQDMYDQLLIEEIGAVCIVKPETTIDTFLPQKATDSFCLTYEQMMS